MAREWLDRVRIVLVETSHPGNIGATARAMHTMGLGVLYLVRPRRFPCAQATARAAGADVVLYEAKVCDTLGQATAGCGWVVGTSARPRRLDWPLINPRDFAERARAQSLRTEVALVFGREHSGLSNEELALCHAHAAVPTNPAYRSLNLAAAVQVFAYELFVSGGEGGADGRAARDDAGPGAPRPATVEELEGFYRHLERSLVDIGYYDPQAPKLLMRRLRRLFNRVQPDHSELNILRGILTAAQRSAGGHR